MGLRDIFKFRDLPESETSKPFLEHLEDLRWTIVKMSIALVVAMILCFCFRSTLVHVMQRPLREVDPTIGALRALAITDSFTISFRLSFYAGIVVSFPFWNNPLVTGPISKAMPALGDITFVVGFVVAAAVYWALTAGVRRQREAAVDAG